MITNYILDILGDNYVVLLDGDKLEKVDNYGEDHIYTTNGSQYFYYPNHIFERWDISIMKTLDARFLLWEAKKWKRECYINFIINYD